MIKRGADSCLVVTGDAPLIDVPAVRLAKEKVIDTTAAGDSFSDQCLYQRRWLALCQSGIASAGIIAPRC